MSDGARVFGRPAPHPLTALHPPPGGIGWTLLALALFSLVVVIPFLPDASRAAAFALEARVASSVNGALRVYYDTGNGYNESDAVEVAVRQSETPVPLHLPLPAVTLHRLRIDPIDHAGTVTFAEPLRIVAGKRNVRLLAYAELQSSHQIASLRETGGQLIVTTTPQADDPQLEIALAPPLVLAASWLQRSLAVARLATPVFAAGLALCLIARLPRSRARIAASVAGARENPRRTLALAAALAVTLSAYPVILLGKSHVSPNFGTPLLYEAYPSLPGYTSGETALAQGSDVAAANYQHVPYSMIQSRAIAHGELPLWNRYNSLGTPLLGQAQSMFGDPLHLFVLAARGAAWAWDVKYLVAKWLFAVGLGFTVLALTTRDGRDALLIPALLVCVAAPFVGFFVFRINHAAIFSLSYTPWVLYSWLRLAGSAGRHDTAAWCAVLFVFNFALLHSGTVKEAYLLLLQMNAAGAVVLLAHPLALKVRLARLAAAVWAGGLVVLISIPVWAPFLQTLSTAYTVSAHPAADQIQPSLLLGAFDELFFRPLSRGSMVFNPSLNFLLLLGLLYFVATLRVHFSRRPVMALASCAAVALAFAFGVVPASAIVRVPLLANIGHIDNCFLCGFIVFGSVLAGVGFTAAAERLRQPEGRADLIVAALLLAALVAGWVGFRQASHRMVYGPGSTVTVVPQGEPIAVDPFIWASLAALAIASGVFAWTARRALQRGALGAPGAIVATLCVVAMLWRQGQHTPAVGRGNFVVEPPPRAPFHAHSPAVSLVQTAVEREPGRVFGLHGNLGPGWNAVYGLEGIHGPDALQNAWLRQLINASPLHWSSSWRLYVARQDLAAVRPLLDVFNVRYYLDLATNVAPIDPALKLTSAADLDVYESPSVWPRAFFADHVTDFATAGELMEKIFASRGQPFAALDRAELSANPALASLARDATPRSIAPATNYQLQANATAFTVRASGPGLVVLQEAWWPDTFRAEVDGRRARIVRVNHAFNGVVIDTAGEHRVKFWYWPRHFTRYLALSATGAVLAALSLLLALRPARPA